MMPDQDRHANFLDRLRFPVVALVVAGVIALAACGGLAPAQNSSMHPVSIAPEASVFPGAVETHSAAPPATTPDLAGARDLQLKLLGAYETALHHRFASEMFFTYMPATTAEAREQAADMAQTL